MRLQMPERPADTPYGAAATMLGCINVLAASADRDQRVRILADTLRLANDLSIALSARSD